jgi:hypothetical protein
MPLRADLAELADWVEGLSAAAHKARDEGNIALAIALETTRFEVYQGYLEELNQQRSQAVDDQEAKLATPRLGRKRDAENTEPHMIPARGSKSR